VIATANPIEGAWTQALSPPPDIPTLEWCEENIVLTRKTGTPYPGRYSRDPSPWVEGWYGAWDDINVKMVVVMKGAQVSATQTLYNCVCKSLCDDPDPVLLAMPSEDEARSNSKNRLQPMMEDSSRIAKELTGREDDWNLLEYHLMQTNLYWIGANSPGKLASRSIRYLGLDEVDKYKDTLGKEGSVIGLALQRAKLWWNRKVWMSSTPTTKAGHIYKYYMRGDQRKWFVPCPHCNHMQFLEWKHVRFDATLSPEEAGGTARYECCKCQKGIHDEDKVGMVAKGEWRPTAKSKTPGLQSYHISGIYSMSDECTFHALTTKFMTVKDEPSDLQDFINSDLGEVWEEKPVASVDIANVRTIRDSTVYPMGSFPCAVAPYVLMVNDIQQDHVRYTVWGMTKQRVMLGSHGIASTLDDTIGLRDRPYFYAENKECNVSLQMIDSGYDTKSVYEFCLSNPHTVPLKGDSGQMTVQTRPVRFQNIAQVPGGDKFGQGVELVLWHIHPAYFKEEALRTLMLKPGSKQEESARIVIRLHDEVDDPFMQELVSEVPMMTKEDRFGRKRTYFKKIGPNHAFDMLQYALAVRWVVRGDLPDESGHIGKVAPKPTIPTTKRPNPVAAKDVTESDGFQVSYGGASGDDADDYEWDY
jgi:phage terminase large subunit GpA-like protein